MSLLDQALEIPTRRGVKDPSLEDMELGLAWLQGKVSVGQIAAVIHKESSGNVYPWLALTLRAAYRAKRLTLSE